ncbi:hypothetical protein [Bartonella grahamii]|uniref:hypothetical protein n=1 Tax=Bartonella grahamii TaxID=33045 RepID=UPI002E7BD876|nr:hypothetical protein [Bartonella grahamii]
MFDLQRTDRILIYGDVSGTTLIHVQNFLKASSKEIYGGKDQSILLIQVAGTAKEDFFELANGYTTVNDFPYQYRLRGYGPSSPFGEADVTLRLVEGEGSFWDFRLEGIYIYSKVNSDNTISDTLSSFASSDPVDSPLPNPFPTSLTSVTALCSSISMK